MMFLGVLNELCTPRGSKNYFERKLEEREGERTGGNAGEPEQNDWIRADG